MEGLFFHGSFHRLFSTEEDSRLSHLDKTFTGFARSPLHIAVMSGDIEFATKIIRSGPGGVELAMKQDSNGFTPLHLASVRTSIPMVRLLLGADRGACMVQDEDGRTPLHLAAMKNRVEIIKLLMGEERLREAIHLRNGEETILHLCVKSKTKLKIIKLLLETYLVPAQPPDPNIISVDSTDNDGNTILHLAVEMGNMKLTNYLLFNNNEIRININIENNKGVRALNMLSQAERDDLKYGFYGYHIRHEKQRSNTPPTTLSKNGDHNKGMKDRVNALLVVATLIAGIAYQSAMNPPGGVWQDDSKLNSSTDPITFAYYLSHMFGHSKSGGGLERYVQENLQNPAVITPAGYLNFRGRTNTSKGEKNGAYPFIPELVHNLWKVYVVDIYYGHMTSKGLILEDFMFADIVSLYNNGMATNSTSRGGFSPYLIRYAGTPILASAWPNHYEVYTVTNAVAFYVSLVIIVIVICGYIINNETAVTQVRILVVLMCISIGCIGASCLTVLVAMKPGSYHGGVVEFLVFFGVCCLLEFIYFLWILKWKIVKLRKRTMHHHIGVVNYVRVLFFSMDTNDAGKIVLFIVFYVSFRIHGYIYYGSLSHKNLFLY